MHFSLQMDNLNITKLDKGVAKCPFNPHANITTLMTENGKLFIGSPTDFSGTDPAILRADVVKVSKKNISFSASLHSFLLHLCYVTFATKEEYRKRRFCC